MVVAGATKAGRDDRNGWSVRRSQARNRPSAPVLAAVVRGFVG